ncbi:hypothetical protein WMF37_41080 [Sorangium sp. So ce291]|uniref:hypothetical protein n=1 Tax=Sorangium sp. So ce291 TaxID=3133294 RepID=UPI003F63319A
MSRARARWDNAVPESFFATLKAELVEHERYPTRAAAIPELERLVEVVRSIAGYGVLYR